MYSLITEAGFDAAHFLAGYDGKCRNIHGHRWRVCVEIQSEKLKEDAQQRGMCVDFSDIKRDLQNMVERFDHMFIIEKNSLKANTKEALEEEGFRMMEVAFRPTAENFAEYFYKEVTRLGYKTKSVHVYETPNNCAVYSE